MVYDPFRVPDLLQTAQYAQAAGLASARVTGPGQDARAARRDATLKAGRQTRVTAVIGEGCLDHAWVRGGTARAQAALLSGPGPDVTARVISRSAVAAASLGPFAVAEVTSGFPAAYLPRTGRRRVSRRRTSGRLPEGFR